MNIPPEILQQLGSYTKLLTSGLYLIAIGMLIIYLLHRIVNRFFYPLLQNKKLLRMGKVLFGALYILVLVITALLVLDRLGHDVSVISQLALFVVTIGAVIAFFLVPFLPTFPFKIGDMVTINGITGIVDAITTYHLHIRTFDGKIVFIPNPIVMASAIVNYNQTPNRRVDFIIKTTTVSDLNKSKEILLQTMSSESLVLAEPAPAVYITNADGTNVEFFAYCWVENANWFGVRSDLWLKLVNLFEDDSSVSLSLPKQEITLSGDFAKQP